MYNRLIFIPIGFLLITFYSCQKDSPDALDAELISKIEYVSRSGDLSHYIMPESDDYASIPNQDPANP